MSMAKNKKPKPAKFVRWRWLVQSGFLLAWLDPLALRMHNSVRAGVSLLLVPVRNVRLPDRRDRQFQCDAHDSLRGSGGTGDFGCGVRQFHLRLGVPFWLSARFDRQSADAQVQAAALGQGTCVTSCCWRSC